MSRQTEKTMKELNAFLKAQRPDGPSEEEMNGLIQQFMREKNAQLSLGEEDYEPETADDYLELDACERVWALEQENPVDILHFGTEVINCGEIYKDPHMYQKKLPDGYLYGRDIFAALLTHKFWHTPWNKVFRRELCLNVVSQYGDLFLPKTNDYPFVWAACYLARSFRGYPSLILYHYRYGLGREGVSNRLNLQDFETFLQSSVVRKRD